MTSERNEPDPLGLLAAHLLAKEQVVLRLGHAAEQRPDDRRVVAGGDAEARVAVDEARVLRRDGDVRQQPGDQAGADRRSVHRRDDNLRAVDQVVDQVARLAPDARAHREVARHLLDHGQVAAGGEAAPLAAQDGDARLRVAVDVEPDPGELRMHARIGHRKLARLGAHHDLEDAGLEPCDPQLLIFGIVHRAF